MWEITDADRLRWQAASVNRLATLVGMAAEVGCPALSWTVGRSGGLVGYVIGRDTDRRAAFEVWAAAIAATRHTERRTPSGATELYAAAFNDVGMATVAITATLLPEDDTGSDDAAGERGEA
jgi:hypothetical protein